LFAVELTGSALIRHTWMTDEVHSGLKRASGIVPWFFLVVAALGAICTLNALFPLRRPWWLKLASFNLGWLSNELPIHVLAANAVVVAACTAGGSLHGRPGAVGLVLMIGSSVGLAFLAAAHPRACADIDRGLRQAFGPDDAAGLASARLAGPPIPRSWLVVPGLAWLGRRRGVERVANVVYATVAGRDLKLDVYRPTPRRSNCPVLVEIHGGGWMAGDRRLEARPLIARMAERGWVCVSVDYRLSPRATWPDHIVDVKTALAWVRAHVAEYGGDPDFVAVTGGSSGGHLAALAALTPGDAEYRPLCGREASVRACVPFYGVHDFANTLGQRAPGEMRITERFVVKAPQVDQPTTYEQAAPLDRVNEQAPPFFVIQGTSDNLVFPAESRAFVDRLRRTSRSPVVYAEVTRGQHAFDAVPSIRTAHVVSGVERFLVHIHAAHQAAALPGGPINGGLHNP
jgi:acetyl esterase/lipase